MRRSFGIFALIAVVALLVAGVLKLVTLRFDTGDVYPEYSSLRSDPLGTMAFYESVDRLSGLSASRDFSTTNRLPGGAGTTYLHLAASSPAMQNLPEDAFREIERFANAGGRLVMTMYPIEAEQSRPSRAPDDAPKPKPSPYLERWGVDYEVVALERDNDVYEPAFVENVSDIAPPLPSFLEWHSGIVFKNLNADWKPIYVRDNKPVMIQRSFGRGMVIIATDSYFVSNEAMLFDRQADLLAYLIGASPNVVFDEAHLGVTESPGVATLARRYRLHGVIASLAALALLFIWKMSMPLLPRQSAGQRDSYITGKDAGAGMINLLRRSVPAADLLETCFTEWKKGTGRSGAYSASRVQQAEDAFKLEMSTSAKQRDPVTAYRTISRILQQIK